MESYGILGHPASHSLSPMLHNGGFTALGLAKSYNVFDIAPHELTDFMVRVRSQPVNGLSVTIPHKQAILPFMDVLTETARAVGAVNTVIRMQDGSLLGGNTDVAGFLAPLRQHGLRPKTALILGAGGAARAVLHSLGELGTTVFVSCRNKETGKKLAQKKGTTFIPWENRSEVSAQLLVNTTPLGMKGRLQQTSPWPFSLAGYACCYDLIYTPQRTMLLAQAREQGIAGISGLEMFIHQAIAQFNLWTGQRLSASFARLLLAPGLCPSLSS